MQETIKQISTEYMAEESDFLWMTGEAKTEYAAWMNHVLNALSWIKTVADAEKCLTTIRKAKNGRVMDRELKQVVMSFHEYRLISPVGWVKVVDGKASPDALANYLTLKGCIAAKLLTRLLGEESDEDYSYPLMEMEKEIALAPYQYKPGYWAVADEDETMYMNKLISCVLWYEQAGMPLPLYHRQCAKVFSAVIAANESIVLPKYIKRAITNMSLDDAHLMDDSAFRRWFKVHHRSVGIKAWVRKTFYGHRSGTALKERKPFVFCPMDYFIIDDCWHIHDKCVDTVAWVRENTIPSRPSARIGDFDKRTLETNLRPNNTIHIGLTADEWERFLGFTKGGEYVFCED